MVTKVAGLKEVFENDELSHELLHAKESSISPKENSNEGLVKVKTKANFSGMNVSQKIKNLENKLHSVHHHYERYDEQQLTEHFKSLTQYMVDLKEDGKQWKKHEICRLKKMLAENLD